ncbi:hypothetical protein FSP39_017874 [Pinctada imbricata]|uniref:Uncharacterized protein n=1 Tax=Pinctada imbricata TaxID=66713 RepID=A0AA88YDW1_PINIB|nr:hypothetical protein FSP39_017874 [Pinctada imbricata]
MPIKTALYQRGDAFNDRPEFSSVRLVSDMKGLAFSHFDARYVLHRKIGGSVLKTFTGIKMKRIKARVNLTDDQIVKTIGDFLGAGFDPTATAMKWVLLFLADNPYVQEKVQREIDDVVGCNRLPTILDRSRLSYTEAMILESLRMGCIAPLALPHGTYEDTELLGYDIPKDTVVFFNLYSSNYDEEVWNHPYEFRPERFLNKEGMVDNRAKENVLTFGVGRRRCVGEQLARMELFLCLSIILQRYVIRKPLGETYILKCDFSLIYEPKAISNTRLYK